MRVLLSLAILFLSSIPVWAEEAYTTAEQARLPQTVMEQLSILKAAGIHEVLVPTWFPSDLGPAEGKVDTSDSSNGPEVEIVWPSSRSKLRNMVLCGIGAGSGGPGPDSTVAVENPVLGDIEMWVCSSNAQMAFRYGTAFGLTVPRGDGQEYYLDLRTAGNSPIGLSSLEMQKILGSVRRLKL